MFIVSDRQLRAMARPGIERLIGETLTDLKQRYPEAVEGQPDDVLVSKLWSLFEETDRIPLNLDYNVKIYLITCIRYRTNYSRLCQNPKLQAVLSDPDWHETEKTYLISHYISKV